jgi:carbon monoxide dehydrogenase subunit G
MELSNEFRVGKPVDEAWVVLTDVERIAPCMPGAELQEVVDDEFRGVVRIKVGPITAQYKGAARFLEKDDDQHRAVLRAEGRETRGQGNANATVTAQLQADGDGTKVSVVTDLMVTGRVAQFGRGVLGEVSAKLLDQFATCLEEKLQAGDSGGTGNSSGGDGPASAGGSAGGSASAGGAGGGATATQARTGSSATGGGAAPVDLLDAAGAPVAKRLLPIALATAVMLWVLRRVRRRRRRRRAG